MPSASDLSLWAGVFARAGRVHIPDFLDESLAVSLLTALKNNDQWTVVMNDGSSVWDVPAHEFESLPPSRHESLMGELRRRATRDFQFLFKTIRISDEGEVPQNHPLSAIAALVNSSNFLGTARAITGDPGIDFADAQATRYEPGHFLTRHNDGIESKNRRAAYVLNFSEDWRAEWGGILEFIDDDGHIAEGYVPKFNSLNVFKVPQLHHVSCVTPFAETPRFSITGWFRSRSSRGVDQ
jgi:hypothetical protein